MKKPFPVERLKRLFLGRSREEGALAVFLMLLLAACLVFVLLAGGDWARAITARVEAGKTPKLEHFMLAGWWWSALVGGGLTLGLCLTRHWWYFESAQLDVKSAQIRGGLRWFGWIFLILVAATFVRWPRMDLSLYNDEADTFVRYIGGSFKGAAWDLQAEVLPEYHQEGWETTFWGNKQGNNHILFSVLARGCYTLDQWLGGRVAGEIHELPLRLPALAGGLLSILMAAVLLRRLGRPQAGIFAAAFLAMHPWHLRFSTEARGYSLLFALILVAVYFLVRALEEPRWKWWMAYALAQCLYLYACLAGVYHAVAINAAVGCFWLVGEWSRGGGFSHLRKWDWRVFKGLAVANTLSLILFLFLIGPSIPQIARATETIAIFKQGMSSGLWSNVISYLAFGMPWFDGDPGNPLNPTVAKWFPGVIMIAGIVVVSALTALGVRGWWKAGMSGRVILAGAVGSGLLLFAINLESGGTVLPWYLVYLTPVEGMTLGLGLAELLSLRRKAGGGRVVLGNRILLYGVIGFYAMVVMKPIRAYRSIGKQAMRDAIELARGGVYPFSEAERRPITAGWWTNADIYDPYLKIAYNKAHINYLMDKADRESRPFYFILGNHPSAVKEDASVIDLLEKSGVFELVNVFPGLETDQYREFVFLYTGRGTKTE